MTEAVLAGEQVKELPPHQAGGLLALALAEVPRLAKYFFVSHRPGDACHRNPEHKQPDDLRPYRHCLFGLIFPEKRVPRLSRFSTSGRLDLHSRPAPALMYAAVCR